MGDNSRFKATELARILKLGKKYMVFKRVWDTCCPHVWDTWEADGVTWVIRDLRPEDDEEALQILLEHLCPDEPLTIISNLLSDPESIRSISEFWRAKLRERMSLGCYEEKDGVCKLVALNVCVVTCRGDKHNDVIEGKAWRNIYDALKLAENLDVFELMGVDKLLCAFGLVVRREYRGARLASKILAAREPLALYHCIKGTTAIFTGLGSQKAAARVGFSTALTTTLKDLAEAGLDYPRDEKRCIKLMVKKYI